MAIVAIPVNQDKDGNTAPLSSLWGELSEHLIASFWEVDRAGKRLDENVTVKAPILDGGNLDITLNWQSPFESAGIESSAPTLVALLQSGSLQPVVDALSAKGGTINKIASDTFKEFENRTGITKLNSTQIFSGMPPVKIQITVLFRAWRDPANEVENPFNQLMAWALPKKLEKDSTLLSRAVELAQNKRSLLDTLLPSVSPVMIAMQYKGRIISPLVIESIGMPITSPINKNGKFIELSVPLSLTTLTAIDREDWANYGKPQGKK